jgi:cytoskeleton-associated protein 5
MDEYVVELSHLFDLFLRWAVLRFVEEKNQSLYKVQSFVSAMLAMLQSAHFEASDNDANVFLPCLCEKVGHNQDRARAGFADLLTRFQAIYNPHRYVVFLQEVCCQRKGSCLPFHEMRHG